MKSRITIAAASLIVISSLLTACSGTATTAGSGSTITVALSDAIDSWNPQEALVEQSFTVFPQVFAALLATSDDGSKIEPGLAKSYEFDDAAKTITFHLDDKAEFSNGKPVTSADVKFSEKLWAAGELYGTYFSGIDSVSAPDAHTVVFTLKRPDHALLGILATANAAIVPNNFGGVAAKSFWKKPISAGAYAIASENVGQSVTLTRNKFYYTGKAAAPKTVKYVVVPDAAQQLLQFQSGKVDVVNNIQLDSVGQYDQSRLQTTTSSGVMILALQTTVAPLDNVDLRRAISLAIDHKALILGGFSGLAVEAKSVLPQVVPGVGACAACDWPATDLAKAKELVKASGYDGKPIVLTTPSEGGPEKLVSEALAPMLAKAGINVTVNAIAQSNFDDVLQKGNFAMAPISYSALAPSPLDPLGFAAATNIIFTGSNVDAANSALDVLSSATTLQEQRDATAGFEAWAYQSSPAIPLAVPKVIYAVSKRVQGFVPNAYKAWYVKDLTLKN